MPDNQTIRRLGAQGPEISEADLVEIYTPERIAEFILMSAVDEEDYQAARTEVREMGLDPDQIKHSRPTKH